jgi:hypothetical protein
VRFICGPEGHPACQTTSLFRRASKPLETSRFAANSLSPRESLGGVRRRHFAASIGSRCENATPSNSESPVGTPLARQPSEGSTTNTPTATAQHYPANARKSSVGRITRVLCGAFPLRATARHFKFSRAQSSKFIWRTALCEYNLSRVRSIQHQTSSIQLTCPEIACYCVARSRKPRATSSSA